MPLVMVVNDQGGGIINCEKSEMSPTLRAQEHGHQPLVVIEDEDKLGRIANVAHIDKK